MTAGLTAAEWRAYEAAGEIAKALKKEAASQVKSGAKLVDLAVRLEKSIARHGARPAFPCNISINEIASHHTPDTGDTRAFEPGDVVKIDIGVLVDGYIADTAFTVEVETDRHSDLIGAADRALAEALGKIVPGAFTCDVGRATEASAEASGFRVLRELLGHELRQNCLHGGLTIPAFDDGSRNKIREGDVLAIEPFLTPGSGRIDRRPGGNILQVIRSDPVYAGNEREEALLARLAGEYGPYPFARRWVRGRDRDCLEGLIRSAALKEYPLLVESDHEPVAQTEHTVIVGDDGCIPIT